MANTFYGTKSDNICAYCWKHHLAMTPKQVKGRQCIAYNCGALQRLEHPMWVRRAQRKQQRVERKIRLEKKYQEVTHVGKTQVGKADTLENRV